MKNYDYDVEIKDIIDKIKELGGRELTEEELKYKYKEMQKKAEKILKGEDD